ncbi:hypothetical protein F5Y06DRAFT_297836 [Hypoxylon sp. FL0890]|nr:hypothetical protein F5Y06DRAFT_297836 [Hypoxylon sp. FL0890]
MEGDNSSSNNMPDKGKGKSTLNLKRIFKWRSGPKTPEKPQRPTLAIVQDRLETETSDGSSSPAQTPNNTDGVFFLRHDGSPLTHSRSGPQVSPNATATFQWIPRAVLSTDSILDPEAKRKVEFVITSCEVDEKEATPQEAYDAIRMAKGSVEDAVGYIKRGERIPSSAEDDPEVKDFLQDLGVSAFTLSRKKRMKFAKK